MPFTHTPSDVYWIKCGFFTSLPTNLDAYFKEISMKILKPTLTALLLGCIYSSMGLSATRYYGAPIVFAGNQLEFNIAQTQSVTLIGKVPSNATNISWSQTGGAPAFIVSPTNLTTEVTQLSVGWNEFQLSATYLDSKGQSKSETSVVKVIVHGDPATEIISTPILPYPKSITTQNDQLKLEPSSVIAYRDARLAPLAEVVSDEVFAITGLRLEKASDGRACGRNNIRLGIDPTISSDEGYRLKVNASGILIEGKTYRGVAWGTVSFIQSLANDASVPWMTVLDEPSARYRGVLIDVARKYHPISYMKELIVMCRLNKINYMQLHLNDVEGTAFPFSNPVLRKVPKDFTMWTLNEVKELVAFADARGVTLVPELEGPGHHSGNLRLLYGRADASGKNAVIDIANENTYIGLSGLLDELLAVFRSTPYVHIGGDESDLHVLGHSPEEMAYIEANNIRNLLHFYIQKMNSLIVSKGRKTIVWEGFSGDGDGLSKDITVMPYESIFNPPDQLAQHGFNLINTAWKPLYVVGTKNWSPDYIYNAWNMWLWEHHIDLNLHIQLDETAPVIGAQMCAWEQNPQVELYSLRYRLGSVAEKVWGPDTTVGYQNFDIRNMKNNETLNRLLGYPKRQESGVIGTYFGFEVFNKPFEVQLTYPSSLGKLYYTLDGSEPTVKSNLYTGPIKISQELTNGVNILYNPRVAAYQTAAALVPLKTRIFNSDGSPMGYLSSTNNYWFQPTSGDPGPVPVVKVGPDLEVKLPLAGNSITITGSVSDEDLEKTPVPSAFKAVWRQVSGSPLSFQTVVTSSRYIYAIKIMNPLVGSYTFQLEAIDSKGNKSRKAIRLTVTS